MMYEILDISLPNDHSNEQQRGNMKKIILAVLLTGALAACSDSNKPECWRATNKTVGNSCNSGGGGVSTNASKSTPRTKVKESKLSLDKKDDVSTPDTNVSNDEGTNVNTNTNNPSTPNNDSNEENNNNPPNQSSSGDVEGYDPFGGLYGPGT